MLSHGFIISQYNKIARRIRRTLQCHVRLHFAIMLFVVEMASTSVEQKCYKKCFYYSLKTVILHVAIINERGLYNVRKSKRKE